MQQSGTYIIRCSTLQSGFDACAGALVTRARNSRADRASPVHGENCTNMRDICFNFIQSFVFPMRYANIYQFTIGMQPEF